MGEKKELLKCCVCNDPVKENLFWQVMRAKYDTDEEGYIALEDFEFDEGNLKYQQIICQTCVKAGRYNELEWC